KEIEQRQDAVRLQTRGLRRRGPRPLAHDRLQLALVQPHADLLAGPDLGGREEGRPRAFPKGDRVTAREDRERAQDLELRGVLGEPFAPALDETTHPLLE